MAGRARALDRGRDDDVVTGRAASRSARATAPTAGIASGGTKSEALEYRRLVRQIERLLANDRLSEARQLNERARELFRRLYGPRVEPPPSSGGGAEHPRE